MVIHIDMFFFVESVFVEQMVRRKFYTITSLNHDFFAPRILAVFYTIV